jgi:cytochrome c553
MLTPLLFPLGVCLAIVTLCYVAKCSFDPWGTCTRCHGDSPTCFNCRGTGKRPRLIWQAAAYLLRTWRDSNR